MVDLCFASQKFILPDGGYLVIDPEFRAMDEGTLISLPYPFVALEFAATHPSDDDISSSRRVIFARERDEYIYLNMAAMLDHNGEWVFTRETAIRRDSFKRAPLNGFPVQVALRGDQSLDEGASMVIGVLIGLLNALECSNVRADRICSAKNKKVQAALGLDEYHVLTIAQSSDLAHRVGGTHRSPREHLRRGHIRRYENGQKLWINATVVNAGVGGKITKDYKIAA
jgi:hypothetical protein